MNRRVVILTLLVALLVLLSRWLLQERRPWRPHPLTEVSDTSDYYLKNFHTSVLGENGRPTHRLEAERLTHYPQSARSVLKEPRLLLYPQQGEPWHLRSDSGTLDEASGWIDLQGNIEIWRGPGHSLQLRTEQLRLHPKRQVIEGERLVTIRSPGTTLRSRGIRGNLQQEKWTLISAVRGEYEPAKP